MSKPSSLITTLCISLLFLQACRKNYTEEIFTPIVNPVIPDFTSRVNASVNGFISDENGNALKGATVKGGTITATTDKFGYFRIQHADFAKSAGFVQVGKAGYFTGFSSFIPVEGRQNFIRLQLVPKIISGQVDAVIGGTVNTTGGAAILLPANGVVNAATNLAYSGQVNVAAYWYDPSDMQRTSISMPGDLTGIDSAGHLNVLQTFGMLAVELTGSNGELLQMAGGKKAGLHFPLPSSLQASAPAYIPLWYFDETKGVWQQQGNAVKNGNGYDGAVSHFSFWNCDIGFPLVNFKVQVTDEDLSPLSNTAVSMTPLNQLNAARTGFTDAEGNVSGMIPANSELKLQINIPCTQPAGIRTFTTTNSNIDLGTIKINLQLPSFQGLANKCSGAPITDGLMILSTNSLFNCVEIINGSFSGTIPVCANTPVSLIAIDKETVQQSIAKEIAPAGGPNDAGVFSTCAPLTGEYIMYTLDDVPTQLTRLSSQFYGNYSPAVNSTAVQAANLLIDRSEFLLMFDGADSSGEHTLNSFTIIDLTTAPWTQVQYVPVSPTTINIAEYGLIGQFISGRYNGTVKKVSDNSIHTLSLDLQVQRDN